MSINYIDILALLIMLLSVYIGFKKGFLKTITGLASLVLSLILAITFYPLVSDFIMKTPVYNTVYESTTSVLAGENAENEEVTENETGKLNLPKDLTRKIEKSVDDAKGEVTSTVAETTAGIAVKIVSILLIFILARIAIAIISLLAQLIRKLPIIGGFDSLLGAVFGIIRGLLIVYVLLMCVTFIASMSPDNAIVKGVKESEVVKLMYNDNALLNIVYKE